MIKKYTANQAAKKVLGELLVEEHIPTYDFDQSSTPEKIGAGTCTLVSLENDLGSPIPPVRSESQIALDQYTDTQPFQASVSAPSGALGQASTRSQSFTSQSSAGNTF